MKKKQYSIGVAFIIALFLYSCGSDNKQAETTSAPAAATPTGKDIYNRVCAACHQASGEGVPNVYPPLAKSDYLADKVKAIQQVLHGKTGEITVNGKTYNGVMPPQQLNDEEIALVLTYVYGNFGNTGGTVTPAEVKAERAK